MDLGGKVNEIERLLRAGQSAAYLDNIRQTSEYPW